MLPTYRVLRAAIVCGLWLFLGNTLRAERPNIILVMADDMGWGQTSYRNHPILKTPNLDSMAASGLRFERFYAGCPVCSPTRASVLTGRTPDRTGVLNHGYALRLQEKTLAQALQKAGYVTGHFGKWHLNGFKGPGAPVLSDDPRHPGHFGFDEWVSVTNFFDQSPLMARGGKVESFEGDSSDIAVRLANDFLTRHHHNDKPMFAVVWFGSPHSPFKALPEDRKPFEALKPASAEHYGELVALDRAVGTLRAKLRDLHIEKNTLLVFCSDNGGLPEIVPDTVGGLRGNKSSVYEGGLRVPGIIEWPEKIQPRITSYPACTMDLFPTIAEIVGLPQESFLQPIDGISLCNTFQRDPARRPQPIGFRFGNKTAWIDNEYKIVSNNYAKGEFALYNLHDDPTESRDLSSENSSRFQQLRSEWESWNASVSRSFEGLDYPEKQVLPPDPESIFWYDSPRYQSYLTQWKDRWEFKTYMQNRKKQSQP